MKKNVLPRGGNTNMSKTETEQQVSPSSTPLEGNNNLFVGLCFCLYINYIVLYHMTMGEFFNYCGTPTVSQFQLSGETALKTHSRWADTQAQLFPQLFCNMWHNNCLTLSIVFL